MKFISTVGWIQRINDAHAPKRALCYYNWFLCIHKEIAQLKSCLQDQQTLSNSFFLNNLKCIQQQSLANTFSNRHQIEIVFS